VEVKVGIQHVSREIVVESRDSASDVEKAFNAVIDGGSGVFALTDERGRKVLIPVDRIAYVDIGEENVRHVGFGAV
jgi:hypothetical protein